jgi:hypothetical protein
MATSNPEIVIAVTVTIVLRDSMRIVLEGVTESFVDDVWVSVRDGEGVVWKIPASNVAYMKSVAEPVKESNDAD